MPNGLATAPIEGYGISVTDAVAAASDIFNAGLSYGNSVLSPLRITFAAVAATDVFNGEFRCVGVGSTLGSLRCIDASAGLPNPVIGQAGLLFDVDGCLCINKGGVVHHGVNGWPVDANGAVCLNAGNLVAPSAFTLVSATPGAGGPNTIAVVWTAAPLAALYRILLDGVEWINSPATFPPAMLTGVPNGAHTVGVIAVNSTGSTASNPATLAAQVGPAPALGPGYDGTDPLLAQVQWLSHLENANTNTDFPVIDRVSGGAGAGFGGAGYSGPSTADKRFGTQSGLVTADYSGGNCYTPSTAGWAVGVGDFALELWIKPTLLTSPNWRAIWTCAPNGSFPVTSFLWYIMPDGRMIWDAGGVAAITAPAGTIVLNQWQFVQAMRISGVTKLGKDGVQVGASFTDATNYSNGSFWGLGSNNTGQNFKGYFDEIRYTRGAAGSLAAARTICLPTVAFASS